MRAPVAFAYERFQALAGHRTEIADNSQLDAVIYEFLEDFSGQTGAQFKKIRRQTFLVHNDLSGSGKLRVYQDIQRILRSGDE